MTDAIAPDPRDEPATVARHVDEWLSAAIDGEFDLGDDPRRAIASVVPPELRPLLPANDAMESRLVALRAARGLVAVEPLDELSRRQLMRAAAGPAASERARSAGSRAPWTAVAAVAAVLATVVGVGIAVGGGGGDGRDTSVAGKAADSSVPAADPLEMNSPGASEMTMASLGDVTTPDDLEAVVNANRALPPTERAFVDACLPVPDDGVPTIVGGVTYAGEPAMLLTVARAGVLTVDAVVYRPESCEILRTQVVDPPPAPEGNPTVP